MDGKASVRQDIEQIQQNQPDTIAAYGEFADNSTSWGRSKFGSIILEECKSIIIDDGIFNENRFSKAFCKNKIFNDSHYNGDNSELGKYNFGLTDSVILLGCNAEMIHKFGPNNFKKTKLSITECMRNNNYTENSQSITPDDIKFFNDWQLRNNPDYKIDIGRGSILIITDLNKRNKQDSFIQLSYFMQGLYNTDCHNTSTWKLFNWIDPEKCNDKCDLTILPNNLMFECAPVINKSIYVYNENDEKIFTEKKKNFKEEYKFELKACFFGYEHVEKEKVLFGKTNDSYRVGFQVRRGGRLLTGAEPKLWGLQTGMNHGKGFRVFLNLPINPVCDKDWCVSTFKKITDDTWKHFDNKIKEFIKNNFNDLVKLESSDRKKKQKAFQKKYDDKLKKMPNLTITECRKESHLAETELKNILNDVDDMRVTKKGSKSYKSIDDYIKALKKKLLPPNTPINIKNTPVNVVETPVNIKNTPVNVVETPVNIKNTPVNIKNTPVNVVETPVNIKNTPVNVVVPTTNIKQQYLNEINRLKNIIETSNKLEKYHDLFNFINKIK